MMAKLGFMPLVKSPIIPSMAEKDNVSTKLGFTVSDDYSINKFMDFNNSINSFATCKHFVLSMKDYTIDITVLANIEIKFYLTILTCCNAFKIR